MRNTLKTYWKTLLFFVAAGLVGGFCSGLYLLDSYTEEIRQQITESLKDSSLSPDVTLGIISGMQGAAYGFFLGIIGIILGKKTGLWKDERSITKKPLFLSLGIAVLGGLVLILSDVLYFGKYSQPIMDSYAVKPSIPYLISAIIYGGIIEEVMLRLFMISAIAFLLHKMLGKNTKKPGTAILVSANMIAAILFAAGHLPATFSMLGSSPMIIFRCFLLNGGLGLMFGYLYRKYGLRYSMIAHGGCHVISKLIWILFI